MFMVIFFFSSRRRHTILVSDWSSDVCSSDLPWTRVPNWLFSELAIGACDLAEVLGSAVALNLMFHIPLFWAVIITGLDVLLLLTLQRLGIRTIEAVVLILVATIGFCYRIQIFS